ncbi:unnamed protein product [Ceutorhynchus assimilis]|uniref:Uncharacterized protein n=1 Tax=Ceutorhynchus assimilis TaxID=467358 RepID=A0A9N9MPC2_9CUCU|nr:unnamed protein product [Ceutorhynchus assimilis]
MDIRLRNGIMNFLSFKCKKSLSISIKLPLEASENTSSNQRDFKLSGFIQYCLLIKQKKPRMDIRLRNGIMNFLSFKCKKSLSISIKLPLEASENTSSNQRDFKLSGFIQYCLLIKQKKPRMDIRLRNGIMNFLSFKCKKSLSISIKLPLEASENTSSNQRNFKLSEFIE